jgi:putative lipoprotein
MMRSASAALAGVALALGACQPDDEGAARARRGAEAAEPIEQPRDEPGANADGDAESPEAVAAPEIGRTFVFDCDGGVSFTARFGPGEMALWSPESLAEPYQVLSLARSGTRYEEGDTVFWSKGNLATIEIAGQRFVDCRSNPSKAPWADAKRRGATFRALGNEPAWYVEIFPDRLAIVTELGTNRTELAHEGPVVASGRTTYRAAADGREATVVIDRRACADSMSGEGFEAFATVSFENRTLLGCGRFL